MVQFLESYLSWLTGEADKRPATAERYKCEIRAFHRWLGDVPPSHERLQEYRKYLQTEKPQQGGGKGARPRTIRLAFGALFSWLHWLHRAGHCDYAPAKGSIKLPRLDRPIRTVADARDIEQLFEAAGRAGAGARSPEYRAYLRGRAQAIMTLLAWAGLRRGELLALDVSDIWRQEDRWQIYIREGKGAQSRSIPLLEPAKVMLADWLAIRHRWCFLHGHTSDALFPVDKRRRLSDRGLDGILGELRELAGLSAKNLTPHSMRHGFASYLYAKGVDAKTIQVLLGHASIKTTLEIYIHTDPARLEEAVDLLGGIHPTDSQRPSVSPSAGASQERRSRRRATPRGRRRIGS